jgi:hypothetical protein
MKYGHSLWLSCTLLLLSASPVEAQEFGRLDGVTSVGTSYHVFAREGEATVRVLVLGVGGGIYEVGASTRIDELMALVSGAGSAFGRESAQVTRRVSVNLYRQTGEGRTLLYSVPVEDMIIEPGASPTLQDGDVFVVEIVDRKRFDWRDGARAISAVSSLILLYLRVKDLF